jgi:hypothetical protein
MMLIRAILIVLSMGGVVYAQTDGQSIPWQQLIDGTNYRRSGNNGFSMVHDNGPI